MTRSPFKPIEIHASNHNDGIWRREHRCKYCKEKFRHVQTLKDHLIRQHDLDRRLDRAGATQ